MAGKYGSPSTFFLAGGYSMLAGKPQTLNAKIFARQDRSDGLGDGNMDATPTGMSGFSLTQTEGFYDTSTNSVHAAGVAGIGLTPQSTPRVVCCGFSGQTIGEMFWGFEGGFQAAYEVLGRLGALARANTTHQITGQLDRGSIIQSLATKTADWNTKTLGTPFDYVNDPAQTVILITSNSQANPTVITTPNPHGLATGDIVYISGVTGSSPTINGERTVTVISTTTFSVPVNTSAGTGGTGGSFVRANSANGGVGYLQVTACSGFSNFVGKLRDSADDVTYADLITFTDNVAAPFAERLTVAGVVDRFLSFDGNVTGSGSITAFCGFARNPSA